MSNNTTASVIKKHSNTSNGTYELYDLWIKNIAFQVHLKTEQEENFKDFLHQILHHC